ALKQPFFSKNSKKDKHQNDVCLQSESASSTFFILKGWRLELPAGSFLYTQNSGGQSFLLEARRLELPLGGIF
ncbi:hypothetical protein HO640_11845, partial [Streptococcus suis]|nr:hypothetical protein [Streptococcus suis]